MANISIYDPRTMGKLVERMPKVQTFIKSTFFRNVETFDTQKIDVDFKFQSTLLQEERRQKCTIILILICNNYCIVSIKSHQHYNNYFM